MEGMTEEWDCLRIVWVADEFCRNIARFISCKIAGTRLSYVVSHEPTFLVAQESYKHIQAFG